MKKMSEGVEMKWIRFIRRYTCLPSDDVLKNAFLLSSELQGETNKHKSFS